MPDNRSATLAQVVASSLIQSIRDSHYGCGERLIELTLAQEMNVSQNTIRDALRLLERDGWVVYHTRRGVYLRSFSADEAEEVYALTAVIEQLAFTWATRDHTRVDLLAALRPPIIAAREKLASEGWPAVRAEIMRFHETVAQLGSREQTRATLTRLYNQSYLLDVDFERHAPRTAEQHEERVEAYEQVLGVIKFSDMDTAAQVLHDCIVDDGKAVVRWLAMHS
jgi:DNA-binding GntR family transcriptional regulator